MIKSNSHTLITFLGRVQKSEHGYRRTAYRLPDGTDTKPTAFIGWTLRDWLHPDRMVILGTAGSMWDVLVESLPLGTIAEDERLLLQEATEQKSVNLAHLTPLTPLLASHLSCTVEMAIIPYARDAREQRAMLQIMADQVPPRSRVSLDVTHGLRHLPMLALLSALHLRVTREADIAGLYYGAFDFDTGEAPVYDLSGLLAIADWVGALHTFDKDGDYSVFAPLLKREGLYEAQVNHLRRAAFFERITKPRDSRAELMEFGKVLTRGLPGIGALFGEQLHKRTQWSQGHDLYEQQRHLARFYLTRGDYIRTAIFAFEALVTRQTKQMGNAIENSRARCETTETFERIARKDPDMRDYMRNYWLLKNLRNTLAHGYEPEDDRLPTILTNEGQLHDTLQELIKVLLPD